MGWFKDLWNKIRGIKSLPEGEFKTVENTIDQYKVSNGDEIALNGARESELSQRREGLLNQLTNSAIELAKSGSKLSPDELMQFAERRGGMPIDIWSENRNVEMVDVKAAMSLGSAIAHGYINERDISSIGGNARLVDEMSRQAKQTASEWQVSPDKAGDYLNHPTDVLKRIKQQDLENEQ